jgi:hypothetical protein
MAQTHLKKQQITAALTALRIQVQNEALLLGRKLDIKKHFRGSVENHLWVWANYAAIFGWLLSRIPADQTVATVFEIVAFYTHHEASKST